METVKLKPAVKDYIWGGKKLFGWGKQSTAEVIAECWELSFHRDGLCVLDDGSGRALRDVATAEDVGKNAAAFGEFPVLIKLIDAAGNLSVQVHPDDEYALKNENSYGKTEMWYVADCDEGAGLYMGFKESISREAFAAKIADGTVLDALNFVKVKKGDSFFIPAGTVHAIGAGVTIIEVQQSSNLTYRVFDYNRVGKDGKPRELHVEKALKVSDLRPYTQPSYAAQGNMRTLAKCKYFTVCESRGDVELGREDSFVSFTAASGEGAADGVTLARGDTYFIPAGKKAKITGDVTLVVTYVE